MLNFEKRALMFSQLLEIMFNLSDVAVVGQFADYKALGAVGSTTLLVTLFTSFLIGMGSGVNVQVGVNSFDAIIVSGNSAAINADSIIFNVMAAFYTACASFIGQNRPMRSVHLWTARLQRQGELERQ